MLIRFSKSIGNQISGIVYYNRISIGIFTVLAVGVTLTFELADEMEVSINIVPVTILGAALAIFLGFRNNSAYDRWWEARKIWGGIVNYSRTWSALVLSIIQDETMAKKLVRRHISWLYYLNAQLRKSSDVDYANKFIDDVDRNYIEPKTNRATQLVKLTSDDLANLKRSGAINDFEHMKLLEVVEEMYNLQGKAERIKGTVFPYYYTYFTRVFLWLFVILLPFSLVGLLGWLTIPISIAISFVFTILDKAGTVTEDPFENRAADVPLDAICRTIEIDLREQIGDSDVPEKLTPLVTDYGGEYLK